MMQSPTKQTTLLFLIEGTKILLAMKKRGFGEGRWNGVGGKPEPGETIAETAVRECHEEIGVTPLQYSQVATLDFYFPENKSGWNQQVIVYICTKWDGTPMETDEMKPDWYEYDAIPYDLMWKDDLYWLPKVLTGNYVKAMFRFDDKDNILEHIISDKRLSTTSSKLMSYSL